MGAWGPGLYSSDLALDLRGALQLLVRTPLSADEIVETLASSFEAAHTPEDEEHSTFWFVLADRLAKAGIDHPETFARARALHASGADSRAMEELGMTTRDGRKRHAAIAALMEQLDGPIAQKPRKVMKPQPLLFARGNVIITPSWNGQVQNPYTPDLKPLAAGAGYRQGWSLAVVLNAVTVFDVVAVYAVAAFVDSFNTRPDLAELMTRHVSEQARMGTLKARHARIMGIERLGQVRLDPDQLDSPESVAGMATRIAAEDISLANFLSTERSYRSTYPLNAFASL